MYFHVFKIELSKLSLHVIYAFFLFNQIKSKLPRMQFLVHSDAKISRNTLADAL